MLSAGGVWGQAGGWARVEAEERWAQRQHRCEGAAKSPRRSGRGRLTRKQGCPGRGGQCSGQLADKTVYCRLCSLEGVPGRIFLLPTLQLARHGF